MNRIDVSGIRECGGVKVTVKSRGTAARSKNAKTLPCTCKARLVSTNKRLGYF